MSDVATKQLNVRVRPAELEAFRKGARRRGLSQSEYVRFLVAKDLEIPAKQLDNKVPAVPSVATQPPQPSGNGAPPAPAPGGDDFEVDVSVWLSNRAFIPVALARAAIGNGHVKDADGNRIDHKAPMSVLRQGVTLRDQPI